VHSICIWSSKSLTVFETENAHNYHTLDKFIKMLHERKNSKAKLFATTIRVSKKLNAGMWPCRLRDLWNLVGSQRLACERTSSSVFTLRTATGSASGGTQAQHTRKNPGLSALQALPVNGEDWKRQGAWTNGRGLVLLRQPHARLDHHAASHFPALHRLCVCLDDCGQCRFAKRKRCV